jgi:hypothetical protein
MTPKVMNPPAPMGSGAPSQQPNRWEKKQHPNYPNEQKWVGKPGYETTGGKAKGDIDELAKWINDMTDWSLMMQDEVLALRDKVRDLEARCCPPQQ